MTNHEFFAMASRCEVCLAGIEGDRGQLVAEQAETEVLRFERRFSRYRPDSDLSRINRAARDGGTVEIDSEAESLLAYAQETYRLSGGLFDPTAGILREVWDFKAGRLPEPDEIAAIIPRIGFDKVIRANGRVEFAMHGMELDFGGFGKEYAADRAVEVCLAQGASSGFVNLGGDIRVVGPPMTGEAWAFGIAHPRDPDRAIAVVHLKKGALATSGDYERYFEADGVRYCHILNPRTGWPAEGLMSVSVIADTALVAGTLSTIAMLKGRQAPSWLDALGVSYVVVDAEGQLLARDLDLDAQ